MSDLVQGQDKAVPKIPTGIYIHVPFCARSCDYCAFYQEAPDAEGIQNYLHGIGSEGSLLSWPSSAETAFWGGGTPGLLSARDLERLGKIQLSFINGRPAEWSVEMTPLSATEARLSVLRELGVNRISLGVQSFRPELLDALGRQHTPRQVYTAYERLRKLGFDNVNFDLMFALPGQNDEEWEQDLTEAIRLGPDHISTYCLTFEEDTKLWVKLSQGKIRRDIEAEARLYARTWDVLAEAGYIQYEISNFARSGKRCLHNLNTWRMHDWIGLGPSASSQYRMERGTNIADTEKWLALLSQGRRATEDARRLDDAALAEDAIIFGLRMNEGVDLLDWKARVPGADWPKVDSCVSRCANDGLALVEGGRLRLTERGRMLADSVGSEFLGLLADA